MADNSKPASKYKFYRSTIHGLKLTVGPPLPGEVAPEVVAFQPYQEMWQGDKIKVGYLKTDDPRAIKLAKDDPNVSEITEDEYNQFTDREVNPKVVRLVN